MSNPGEWITFDELCLRVPLKSARTLRRYYRDKLISYRQAKRGGAVEFNWKTVSRELQILETAGVNADRAAGGTAEEAQLVESLISKVTGLEGKLDEVLTLLKHGGDHSGAEGHAV